MNSSCARWASLVFFLTLSGSQGKPQVTQIRDGLEEIPVDWATIAVATPAKGQFTKENPGSYSESMAEVSVEARLQIDAPAAATITERPGRFKLRVEPEGNGGMRLVWEVRVDGLWEKVGTEVPAGCIVDLCAGYDGSALLLSVNGRTVKTTKQGLLSPGTEGLWLGSARDGKEAFPGTIQAIRVSRTARDPKTFLAAASTPVSSLNPTEAAPQMLNQPVNLRRPDGIVDQVTKVFPAPRLQIPRVGQAPNIDGSPDDAFWRQAPAVSSLPVSIHYEPPGRHDTPYAFRASFGWDDKKLYGFLRLIAPGPGYLDKGDTRRDSWEGIRDRMELFLCPTDPSISEYFLFKFGAGGGLFDGRGASGVYSGNWNVPAIEYKIQADGDSMDVEFAIPFSSFAVPAPKPGDAWKGNIVGAADHFRVGELRRGNLLPGFTSWAYSWPLREIAHHFGTFEFVDAIPATGQATSSLRGRLVDEQGNPLVWNSIGASGALDVNGKQALTSDEGWFEVNGLAPGSAFLQTFIPTRNVRAMQLSLKPGMNDLGDLVLQSARPIRPAWASTPEAGGKPVAWFQAQLDAPPDMVKKPAAQAWEAPGAEAILAPGETGSIAAAFLAKEALIAPSAEVGPLTSADGKVLPAGALKLGWVTRQLVANHNTSPESSRYEWRHICDRAPAEILAGETALLALTVRVPGDAAPGDYRGEIRLNSRSKVASSVAVRVTVAPFRLAPPVKLAGLYYYLGDSANGNATLKPPGQIDAEIQDQFDHGCRTIWICPFFMNDTPEVSEAILRAIRSAAKAGMRRIVTTFPPFDGGHPWDPGMTAGRLARPQTAVQCKAFVSRMVKIEREFPGLEIIPQWGDEVTLRHEYWQAWKMQYDFFRKINPTRKVAVSAHPLHDANFNALARTTPKVLVNWSYEAADRSELKDPAKLAGWAARLNSLGLLPPWCYMNGAIASWHDKRVRLSTGYWLEGTPFQAHVPWVYSSYAGDPLNPFDAAGSDVGFAVSETVDGRWETFPALSWELWRDGANDHRWTATLARVIASSARAPNDPALVAAKSLLARLRERQGDVHSMAARFPSSEFLSRRKAILEAVAALTGVH